jgi:hypothetical protein
MKATTTLRCGAWRVIDALTVDVPEIAAPIKL